MARSSEYQAAIISFLNYLATRPQVMKSVICHKRYALAGKLVDLLAETAVHTIEEDLYAGAENIVYTNVLFTR
jgi:hypothetical protein